MAKKKKNAVPLPHEHHIGVVQDNAYAAIVRSSMFKSQQHKALKGKGSYNRARFKRGEAYQSKTVLISLFSMLLVEIRYQFDSAA
ncbi:alternative ribosome rescue factor ArfA [Vibrio mediterranei]|uniref:alternative ribosome rescue factor ArfA n=1 Tax=Vibrio mediterranei TaxID=689 RepID=UPI0040698D12